MPHPFPSSVTLYLCEQRAVADGVGKGDEAIRVQVQSRQLRQRPDLLPPTPLLFRMNTLLTSVVMRAITAVLQPRQHRQRPDWRPKQTQRLRHCCAKIPIIPFHRLRVSIPTPHLRADISHVIVIQLQLLQTGSSIPDFSTGHCMRLY
eukprot:443142-Rhodomonas_salina.1